MIPDKHRAAIRNYIVQARANLVMVEATLHTVDQEVPPQYIAGTSVRFCPDLRESELRAAVSLAADAARKLEIASEWLTRA